MAIKAKINVLLEGGTLPTAPIPQPTSSACQEVALIASSLSRATLRDDNVSPPVTSRPATKAQEGGKPSKKKG